MTTALRVLIVEDNQSDAELMVWHLQAEGFAPEWRRVETSTAYLAALEEARQANRLYELILCDWRLPQFDGRRALRLLQEMGLDIPFIIVSGSIGEEAAVDILRQGAHDYVLKDRPNRLGQAARRALADRQLRLERRQTAAALKQREHILEAVAFAADAFLAALDWEDAIDRILDQLGQAADVSRVYIFENHVGVDGNVYSSQRFEWCAPGIAPQIDNPELQAIPLQLAGVGRWVETMGQGELLFGHVRDFPDGERAILDPQGILSLAVVPVFANESWWGFVGFDQCDQERNWSWAELKALRAAVNTLSVAIERKQAVQTLRAERDFSMQVMNTMGQGLTVVDQTGRLEYVNPALSQMLGYPPEKLLGRSAQDFVRLADHEILERQWQERLADQATSYETRLLHADGSEIPVLITGTPRRDGSKIVGSIAVITDISERQERQRQLEAITAFNIALRRARSRAELPQIMLAQLMEQLDVAGAALQTIDPASNLLHLELGLGIWAPLTGMRSPADDSPAAAIITTGQIYRDNNVAPDNHLFREEIWTNCRAALGAPLDAQGEIIGALWVASRNKIGANDVQLLTAVAEIAANAIQQENLREAVAAQARRVQIILDTVPGGVVLLDTDGRILLTNPAAEQLLPILTEQDSPVQLTHLGRQPLGKLLSHLSATQGRELEIQGRHFQVAARPLALATPEAAENAARQWVLVISDETDARERQRYQQAQQQLATVGQLAAGIAHDFNNIMSVIVLYAQLLQRIPHLTERQQSQLEIICTQANRATNLVQQILDFSRRSMIQRTPLDLLPLVKETLKLLERIVPENIRLELAYDSRSFMVNADPTQMQQMLMNLALNARDAMPQGGTLRLSLSALELTDADRLPLPDVGAGDWVQLTVVDTGAGIAAEDLPHVFEPFFTTKEPDKGTGLGLAQVYGIVKQHEGAIDVSSQPDQGAAFSIYLPRLGDSLHSALTEVDEITIVGQGKTILLVEDNSAVQEATATFLNSWGFQVLQARTGLEALALLAQQPVDLVLSDLIMPEMGGIELGQHIREIYPGIKLLFMTGYAPEGEHSRLLQETNWLAKPFTASTLAAKVSAILTDPQAAAAEEETR